MPASSSGAANVRGATGSESTALSPTTVKRNVVPRLSALSTWIHSVAVSAILSGLRKVKRLRNREAELDEVIARTAGVGGTDVVLKIRLHQAIDALPDDLRMTLIMHDIEGYKHHEIAEIFDAPTGTIKSRLSRARSALRDDLAGGSRRPAEEDWR